MIANEARWQLRLDRVLLIPAAKPPHKPSGPRLSAEERARLVRLAIGDDAGLELSRLELDRPGPSYTVDTLEAVHAAEPAAGLWFVMGADQLLAFATWHGTERILELARLAVIPRGGLDRDELEAVAAEVAPERVDWVDCPEIGVSSSLLRRRMELGRPIRHLVPARVEDELRRMGLIRSDRSHDPEEARSPRSS